MESSVIKNQLIVERYAGQPARLPRELRDAIEAAWNGAPVQLYALADLDHQLHLTEAWLALGPEHIALAKTGDITLVPRDRITAVLETPGLSSSTLSLLGAPGDPPLLVARYSHRQKGAMENLRFVLAEALEGRAASKAVSRTCAVMASGAS